MPRPILVGLCLEIQGRGTDSSEKGHLPPSGSTPAGALSTACQQQRLVYFSLVLCRQMAKGVLSESSGTEVQTPSMPGRIQEGQTTGRTDKVYP